MLCSRCKKDLSRTRQYFYADKRRKDGLASECKKCKCLQTSKWAKQNPKLHRKYGLQYYYRHKNTIKGQATLIMAKIKSRCYNPKNNVYNYYGKRGIRVCFTKVELQNWLQQNNVNPQGLVIHRIRNDRHYSLGNIVFMGKSEHAILHNKRRIR